MLRLTVPQGEIELRRAEADRPTDVSSETLDAWRVRSVLEGITPFATGRVVDFARAFGASPHAPLSALVDRIVALVDEGRVIARMFHRTRIDVPRDAPPALGPSSEPPPPSTNAWVSVTLLDATGAPLAGVDCAITPPGSTAPKKKPLGADGSFTLDGIEPGKCTVVFPGLADRDAAPLALEAKPPQIVPNARSIVRAADAKERLAATTGAEHVFQLRRPVVEVIEIEHFNPGSAVFQPGPSPWDPDRGPRGLDVLRMALAHARTFPADRVRIVGHVASNHPPSISRRRAEATRALLVNDEDAFVTAVSDAHVPSDVDALLLWVAEVYGWACAPKSNRSREALRNFQSTYAQQTWAGCALTAARRAAAALRPGRRRSAAGITSPARN